MNSVRHRLSTLVRRVGPLPWQLVRARIALRSCDEVGQATRVARRFPIVRNDGSLRIGRRGVINSRYAPVALESGPGATLTIGDRHVINFGTALRASTSVTIGDDVTIGPYCIVDDRHLDPNAEPAAEAISIGHHCWLASRVVVLPGSVIGDHAVIAAGTIVDGEVPPSVLYGGAPARILKQLDID